MARGQRTEHDPKRKVTRDLLGYLRPGMDPDEAAIAPKRPQRLVTPDYIRDTRALLEHERMD
jgi:hypothetical protein